MKHKIGGMTKVSLYDSNNKRIMKCEFMNVIGYLFNRELIDLPDEYWIEEDNGWKSYYRKNYNKIFRNFNKLVNGMYRVELD